MEKHFMVKKWDEFQQYKDREPKWIKLYRSLLTDYEFTDLTDEQKCHLMLIWLLAAQMDNKIPWDADWVALKIGATSKVDLDALCTHGFIIPYTGSETTVQTIPMPVQPSEPTVHREEKIRGEKRRLKESRTTPPAGAVMPQNSPNGIKPPNETHKPVHWLCYGFALKRMEFYGDRHFNWWDPKYLGQSKHIIEKKAGGDYQEVLRRTGILYQWSQTDQYYQFTLGDLESKWEKLVLPPNARLNDESTAFLASLEGRATY